MSLKLVEYQPELKAYETEINDRARRLNEKKYELLQEGQSLSELANGHLFYGLHRTQTGWVFREWAPAAEAVSLIGDFNCWDRGSHMLHRTDNGSWEIMIDGHDAIKHRDRYKVCIRANGQTQDRIPLYARYVCQEPGSTAFNAVVWAPPRAYEWGDAGFDPERNVPPFIYEAHIGMSAEEPRIATYREFADNILPRIRDGGYNTVQLMAIMEHPYYASFGYQVSSFFAASSRYGTPDDLKYLIDRAHGMGLSVLLDLVHSHTVKNTAEGIAGFDGTDTQFFKEGADGWHPAWDSRVFDYGKTGVLHFLLSNLKFWLTEYHFDGFRFDGVGSMLYRDHGLGASFGDMDRYFSPNTDYDAVTYLQLATELCHQLRRSAVLIAEDVSAMPGLCAPVCDGGIGFDYRLSMGLPDFFIQTIKERSFGNWDLSRLSWELLAHRNGEKRIAYAESHDQALVGDQTIMFRLAGPRMYTGMSRDVQDITVQQAMAMHKLIRLLTLCAGGDGYLNFMGNEFGHPDWIDFPREGNGWSYEYARRRWSLADNGQLRFRQLGDFDRAAVGLIKERGILFNSEPHCIRFHQDDQILVFERNGYLFAFNLHPTRSQVKLFIPADGGCYAPLLSSDDSAFGGWNNISKDLRYYADAFDGQLGRGFSIYLPALTAVVLGIIK